MTGKNFHRLDLTDFVCPCIYSDMDGRLGEAAVVWQRDCRALPQYISVTAGSVVMPVKRGRPKRRWLDNIKNDLSEKELSGEEAQMQASHMNHIKVGKEVEEDTIFDALMLICTTNAVRIASVL